MPEVPTLTQVLALLEQRAEPSTAEDWDRVGLVAGDPDRPTSRVMFAVDATPAVVADAVAAHVDLLVTHHPLLLRGVSSIAETTSRGRSLAALIRSGCALFTMHTNADQAEGGVTDALADAIGMAVEGRRALRPLTHAAASRVIVFVPPADADALIEALSGAGAGRIGDHYDTCAYWVDGTGQFRPTTGAQPRIGRVGEVTQVDERRVEMVFPPARTDAIVRALRDAHPYEEPAFSIVASPSLPTTTGIGRVGQVAPATLGDFARTVAAALPANAAGVRVAGDPDREVREVAVCGGSGDSLLPDVADLGVDVYITSDLRHHPALDFICDHAGIALIDVPHASGESLWLHDWSHRLVTDAAELGFAIHAQVNPRSTDPWTFHVPTGREETSL